MDWFDLIPFLVFGVVVADASVAIRGDMSGFHSDLNSAERRTQTFRDRVSNFLSPKGLLMAGGIFGLGQSIPTLAGQITRFLGDTAAAYSEFEQTQRTVDSVFGDSANVIENWAKRSADAAGMSKRVVFQAASVMGQTLINMGFSAGEAADKVVMLQQRAAEMAVAFGQTPERAILAITAAMRGERDTIEKFGVSIKQVDVNSRVAAMGLDVSTDAAKKNADAIAILDIIMEQTGAQAGRFADGQDDIAVKMAKAQAKIEDAQLLIGQEVASIQLGAIKVAEATGDYLDTASRNIDDFTINFGAQRMQVMALADKFGMDFEVLRDRIIQASDFSGLSHAQIILELQGADELEPALRDILVRTRHTATIESDLIWAAMAASADRGLKTFLPLADEYSKGIPEAVKRNWELIRQSGEDSVAAYNQGIFEAQDALNSEVDRLLAALDTRLTPGEEMARIRGQLMELGYARGIWEEKGDKGAVAAIDALIADLRNQLDTLNAHNYGVNLVRTLVGGIWTEINTGGASHAAAALAGIVARPVMIESEPPDHSSPLYGITKWGGNIVKTIAGGMMNELGTGSAATMALAGALVPSMGATGGAIGYGGGVAASQTTNYNLTVNGVPYEVRSPDEMVDQLMGLSPINDGRLA